MEDTVALIDRIIDEHRVILGQVQGIEQASNDFLAMAGLEQAKEAFVPGRLNQMEGLKKLQEMLGAVDEGLKAHFTREETGLITAFKQHGNAKLADALHTLLLEHRDLRDRLARCHQHVNELIHGNLTSHKWNASAHDTRAFLAQTRKHIQQHAHNEEELLHTLRRELTGS